MHVLEFTFFLFLAQHNSLEIHPSCVNFMVCSLLLLISIPCYEYTTVSLTIYLFKDIWIVSSFLLLQIKLL